MAPTLTAPTRRLLRIAGPALLVVGLYFSVTSLVLPSAVDPVKAVNAFRETAVRMTISFVLVAVGGAMTYYGYIGAATRYVAAETRPAIAIAAGGVAEGLASAGGACAACGAATRAGARHCGHCGATLAGAACPACGAATEAGHRHCDRCGAALKR
ncbi:MAG TPA: zinc ribbon domain-containing protein [Candidatus Thermoplasmatota archaeon]|nr:zinc ribbon domain-containing protein [Candidatus Thermoplasmatota archaeon]